MPAMQVRSEVIVAAVQLACRAPSLHNTQPWRWVAGDRFVKLFADPTRLARSADPVGREALISCGAVLNHLQVAMSAAGWDSSITRWPDRDEPLHLATIEFAAAPVSAANIRRADAILWRHTDRLPLSPPPGWAPLAQIVGTHTGSDGVRVDALSEEDRTAVALASRLAEEQHQKDFGYRNELSWWTGALVNSDGIAADSLLSAEERERVDVGRTFPAGHQTRRRSELRCDRSTILALWTEDDSRTSVLRCGETLSSVLLDATLSGMSTCAMTHVTEVPSSRDIIASLLPQGAIPQVLVRVGLAPAMDVAPPPTPRRPIEQVLEIHRETTC
ncbi:MAG: NAD(P)H nitroreductase [Mycolicibacterium sp.]|uniref:Acg family FMN-binding oxidoreductase n=1 Tax=Mycolicibacterium sp. TaxID=2320850 RepID=UPI003D0CFFD1